jgi:hypothetical protein
MGGHRISFRGYKAFLNLAKGCLTGPLLGSTTRLTLSGFQYTSLCFSVGCKLGLETL